MRIITFLSDFGGRSPYPAAMKAAAAAVCDGAAFIDITHDVRRHHVAEGAYLLFSAVPAFPAGTVHVAVVDPGVGTVRASLVVAAGGQWFVGPDNGLLLPAARRLGAPRVCTIRPEIAGAPGVSSTFHGRDVFAPVGGRLSRGEPVERVAAPADTWVDLDFGAGGMRDGRLEGKIIYVDPFGNLITNIPASAASRLEVGTRLAARVGRARADALFVPSYGHVRPGALAVVVGSDGLIEVAINQGSAAGRLRGSEGAAVALVPVRASRPARGRRAGNRRGSLHR
ncbi:MAG: SAM-dependent chlorinase/fluorinase [Armatimonadetes bacterium]|nr:SAM-dependent chlorinase/fluorinase [Armatimonadota bacterium]